MRLFASFRRLANRFRPGSRSLKLTLGLYFLPISILPAIFLSLYATRVFEDNAREGLRHRAENDRDALVAEVARVENELMDAVRELARSGALKGAMGSGNSARVARALSSADAQISLRVYSPSGKYLGGRIAPWDKQQALLPERLLALVKRRGETRHRHDPGEGQGIAWVVRRIVRDSGRLYGVVEAQARMGQKELAAFKSRRQVDAVILNKEMGVGAASFALPAEFVRRLSKLPYRLSSTEPTLLTLGEVRFATFLFELPAAFSAKGKDGYFVLFLSMTAADAAARKLGVAMVYLTGLLVLCVALLILLLSNRIVEPIELLVLGMKRIRTGKNEEIPMIDSPYEIEYLVHSFNEMASNVARARKALEDKVEELRDANVEIRDAQGALVQSAKMISLGQLVAGVAHELNNPIAFISSNMHHLGEYVERIRRLVSAYQTYRASLPAEARAHLEALEKEIEIDFLLGDMIELTRSCVEGANRTKEIVLGLRSFSRMEESVFRLCDIHEGMRNTIRLLVTEFKDRVTIHEEFGAIPDIECNLSQINQVFMNLLSNAAQAIEGRGDIWVRTQRVGEMVRIQVEDNGAGMPPQVRQKIFDPFFTTKTVGKGTGLGLSIAYGLIEKHHGTIEVESEVGRGTRFTIHLPVRQPVSLQSTGEK